MKVSKDDVICMRFRVIDAEQASQFLGEALETMLGKDHHRGVLVTASSRDDVFREKSKKEDLLEKVAQYLRENVTEQEAWDLLDEICEKTNV